MSKEQIQNHIIEQVTSLDDVNVLAMIDEELSFYLKHKNKATSLLSENDLEELVALANEPFGANTMSFNEFKVIVDAWRTK